MLSAWGGAPKKGGPPPPGGGGGGGGGGGVGGSGKEEGYDMTLHARNGKPSCISFNVAPISMLVQVKYEK